MEEYGKEFSGDFFCMYSAHNAQCECMQGNLYPSFCLSACLISENADCMWRNMISKGFILNVMILILVHIGPI
jgi:hypothetical protein